MFLFFVLLLTAVNAICQASTNNQFCNNINGNPTLNKYGD